METRQSRNAWYKRQKREKRGRGNGNLWLNVEIYSVLLGEVETSIMWKKSWEYAVHTPHGHLDSDAFRYLTGMLSACSYDGPTVIRYR